MRLSLLFSGLIPALVALFAAPALAEMKIEAATSPGGVPFWLVEDHSQPFTALSINFLGGTALDAAGKRGAVTLMTGLLEEGSGKMDSQGFAEAREALAARMSFDPSADAVTVSARFLTENRNAAIDLLHQALVDPTFDAASIKRVKGQIAAIQKNNASDPGQIASDQMDKLLFGAHPYGTSDLGTPDSLKALTRADLVAAHDAALTRDRVRIAASGDINAAQLGLLIDKLVEGLPAKGGKNPPDIAPDASGKTVVLPFDTPQSSVVFAQKGLRIDDPDYFAAAVLQQIVGGQGFSAILLDEVREKRGLTYGIGAGLSLMSHSTQWRGGFASANDRVAEAVTVVRDIWAKVADKGVTSEQVEKAKTYMTGSYPLQFNGNVTIAAILGGMQVLGLPPDYVTTRNDKVKAVTLTDVNRVAKSLMTPDKLTFVVVGQPKDLATSP